MIPFNMYWGSIGFRALPVKIQGWCCPVLDTGLRRYDE